MNYLFLRRLCAQYLPLKSQKTSIPVSYSQVLRHLTTFPDKQFSRNNCLNGWQTTTRRALNTSQEFAKVLANPLGDLLVQQKRFGKSIPQKHKKGKKKMNKEKEESDDESDDDDKESEEMDADLIDGKAIGFQDLDVTLISLRLDNVLKAGLNMARGKVDEAFYAGLIRVNGQKVAKKSVELTEKDEIDLIRGFNVDNQDLLDISRVVIKNIEDKLSSRDRIVGKFRKFRVLTIENYADDPYDGFAINVKKDLEPERK